MTVVTSSKLVVVVIRSGTDGVAATATATVTVTANDDDDDDNDEDGDVSPFVSSL